MKKFKKAIVIAILITSTVLLSACSIKDVLNYLYYGTYYPYTAASPIKLNENETLEQLMQTRDSIRKFNIYIETTMYNYKTSYSSDEQTNIGSGSIIGKNASTNTYYAITNFHVINYGTYLYHSYKVETLSGKEYTAQVLIKDSANDMAIISFISTENLGIANLTNRTGLDLGTNEFVLAVGNPNGVKFTVTYGVNLGLTNIENVTYMVINHTALIKPGNSGGALTDIQGNLVGMNTWGTEDVDTDNYAIPLSTIKTFITQAQNQITDFPTIVA